MLNSVSLKGFKWQNLILIDEMLNLYLHVYILFFKLTNFSVITENDWQVLKLFNISEYP